MRIRYTDVAAFELDASILSFIELAPLVAADFVDSVNNALTQLLEHRIRHRRRISRVFAGYTSVDFGT
jgi:hypothetical protein